MAAGLRILCLFAAFSLVLGDCYLHNPRGSNNRLNERSANRRNANRMFDSQNNNRGGYNAGDEDTGAFNSEDEIYYMKYFQSGPNADTLLTIEWTNQHGCGGNEDNDPHKVNCNLVIQYMVQDYDGSQPVSNAERFTRLRNGENTNTQNYQSGNEQERFSQYQSRRNNNVQADRGIHETFDYYDDCYTRTRNLGLFTADQRLRSNNFGVSSAIYTRQNPNGNRRGYECPEERDYYPYWHPNPWRDIAVLTDNVTLCDMYQRESFNVQPRQRCRETFTNDPTQVRPRSEFNNETGCTAAGGVWFTEYGYIDIDSTATSEAACNRQNNSDGYRRVWAPRDILQSPECLVLPGPPACMQGGWTRVNHLGNSRDGVPLNITWRIPYFPSNTAKLAVVRVRYNISTDDYHPWLTNASYNDNAATRSPITQNPHVDIGSTTNKPLRLAINTAQFGRTFQDRSHVMVLRPRQELPAGDTRNCRIHNLNVRGKRGNIVQVYPAVEYDFVPNRLTIPQSDCLHIQWTGSNTHNNGAPGGDGQTGDAGEGTGGTDRHNIVEIPNPNANYPLPWENSTLFNNVDALWTSWGETNPTAQDIAVAFASSGYYKCYRRSSCTDSVESRNPPLQQLLDNAPASFEGALLRFQTAGMYHYICSRNNNFTNRSQKGQITVQASNK